MIRVKVPHLDKKSKFCATQKFLLLFLTLLQIAGIVTIPVGVWLSKRLDIGDCDLFSPYVINGNLLLASGILSVLLCWSGFIIVLKADGPKANQFRPYIFFFWIIVSLQISATISATINESDLRSEKFEENLFNMFRSSNGYQDNECSSAIHKEFRCCGFKNYTDLFNQTETVTMLKSCDCNKEEDDCLDIKINSTSFNIYPLPCHSKILDEIHSQNSFVLVYSAVLPVLEVLLFTFVSCMLHRISGPAVVETRKSIWERKTENRSEIFQAQTYI